MKYWLMKAEPDSRLEKGKDVKFSIDDFESVKTTPWEGVRNHEAKKLMQSMKIGDQVLFYHSNCKNPGVAGFAEVSKEAYPDYTAWDSEHPYYDPKSDKDNPRWFMVDVTLKSRAAHLVPLSLFKRIASSDSKEPPLDVSYIGTEGVNAIKEMALVKRGRLSVQPVEEDAWTAVQLLAEKGGWKKENGVASATENGDQPKKATKRSRKVDGVDGLGKELTEPTHRARKRKATSKSDQVVGEEKAGAGEERKEVPKGRQARQKKRKADETAEVEPVGSRQDLSTLRRSTRSRR